MLKEEGRGKFGNGFCNGFNGFNGFNGCQEEGIRNQESGIRNQESGISRIK